ncbi:hypothetical protein C8R47DRAFT_1130220 [Mycena vitilis]|nr:hypothetical protein C8R47DRAFT_1130220 [Mycena vitilis]
MSLRRLFRPSNSNDWISHAVSVSRGLVSMANCAPFPYVSTALAAGLALLELIQTVGKTTDDLKYLAESVVAIMELLGEEIDARPATPDLKFIQVCVEFNMHLTRLSKDIESMSRDWSSFKFKKYIKVNCIRDEITQFTRRVSDLRANATLIAAAGTRLDLVAVANDVCAVRSSISRIEDVLSPTVYSSRISNTSTDLVRLEEDFHALKVGDIQLAFETAQIMEYTAIDGCQKDEIGWTDYKGFVKGAPYMVRVYRGPDSAKSWENVLRFLADHSPSPGLPQVFGYCPSPKLQSIIFHGEFKTLDEYGASVRSSHELVAWETALISDFTTLTVFHRQRGFHLNIARPFARVDAQNGKLMMTHVETSPQMTFETWPWTAEPFLRWFAFSDAMSPIEHNQPSITSAQHHPSPSLYAKLRGLRSLVRRAERREMNRSLYEILTSRGCVYDCSTGNIIARLPGCETTTDASWRVRFIATSEFFNKAGWSLDLFPHVDARADIGWTHFVVPLRRKSDNWLSCHDHTPRVGYFLDANIQFGCNTPNISLSWLAQSGSFTTDTSKHSLFVVPLRTGLNLTWELVLSERSDDLQEAVPEVHVFVQVPILGDGRVLEPQIHWSTDPAERETSRIPTEMFQIRLTWQLDTEFGTWERHHYDVAKSLQEQHGFDPTTNAAAKVLELPLLEACRTKPAIFPVEDEWCIPRSQNRDGEGFILGLDG